MLRPAILAALLLAGLPAAATEAGWALLRNAGQVVLISHADAPGTGDPANFDIENCATQRNLSGRGRQQARQMGALVFARAAPIEEVLSSRYCRAKDTARLAFDTEVREFPPLDELSGDPEIREEQLEATLEQIRSYTGAGNLLMVTHPANIEALAGVRPREVEAIILSRSGEQIGVAGRVSFR